jgi:hypothetical protein
MPLTDTLSRNNTAYNLNRWGRRPLPLPQAVERSNQSARTSRCPPRSFVSSRLHRDRVTKPDHHRISGATEHRRTTHTPLSNRPVALTPSTETFRSRSQKPYWASSIGADETRWKERCYHSWYPPPRTGISPTSLIPDQTPTTDLPPQDTSDYAASRATASEVAPSAHSGEKEHRRDSATESHSAFAENDRDAPLYGQYEPVVSAPAQSCSLSAAPLSQTTLQ